jgi:hypothetical protein
MQSKITAGDTLAFSTPAPDHPAGQGWKLFHRLVPAAAGGAAILLESEPAGDDHRTTATADETATWPPGAYTWFCWAERMGARQTLSSGQATVLADPATMAAGADTRSHARKVLDAIQAVIEKRATLDQERYTVLGRELWRTPIPDLLKLRGTYAAMVRREERKAAGRPLIGAIRVRI